MFERLNTACNINILCV